MSRNLAETSCPKCCGVVIATSPDRPATAEDVNGCREFVGMLVSDARCSDCGVPFLAWHERPFENGIAWTVRREDGEALIMDLSYRHSFNDEPHPDGRDDPAVSLRDVMAARRRRAMEWDAKR